MNPQIRAAFLLSQHPAINHALLLREIRQLRSLGMEIHTISIRPADRPAHELTPEERDEEARTFYVNPLGISGALPYHWRAFISWPIRYLRTALYAISLGDWNLKKTASLIAYFAQAVVVGGWMAKSDITHLHAQYSSTVALLTRRCFNIELSISFHGPDEFTDPAGFWLREKIEQSYFVRAISYYGRSQLMKSCDFEQWRKIDVAYMGIDPESFQARPFRLSPSPFEILCVGRLAPVKAQHILIEAVAELRKQGRSVLLHLAGGGPDRASLERATAQLGVQNSVRFHGWMQQSELDSLYRRVDVFVLASFAEGLPGVLMEAMAMEIPCVSTWITGVPELIRHDVDGLLTPPADASAIAQAVARLMDEPDLRLQIGKAGRLRVIDMFHLEKNGILLRNIFHSRLAVQRS